MEKENNINWERLISSMAFYASIGYTYRDLNWTVSRDVSEITKTNDRKDYLIEDRAVVASGEQSFLELIKNGKLKQGKYHGITPCFRDETTIDYLHQRYFMKVELINTLNVSTNSLDNMVLDAFELYSKYLDVKVTELDKNLYDIVDLKNNIELGSYGIRTTEFGNYCYGTGIAEPRLSKVLKLQ